MELDLTISQSLIKKNLKSQNFRRNNFYDLYSNFQRHFNQIYLIFTKKIKF